MVADYIVIGSGVTGATIARSLADAGREVVVVERRCHIGGNVADKIHFSGIRFNLYGPHYFRTNSPKIWSFASRFAPFEGYEAKVLTLVDGRHYPWPLSHSTIEQISGTAWAPAFAGTAQNFEQASLALMPELVYQKFVKNYSEKQWGVPASELDATLARRLEVRRDSDTRLVRSRFQGLPTGGFTQWISSMLAGIPVVTGTDYLTFRRHFQARKLLVFTGPIDEFFDFRLGRLQYRGQRRRHRFLSSVQFAQPCGQVNNPDSAKGTHIRVVEWKHMMPRAVRTPIASTLLTIETPCSGGESDNSEYPFPNEGNRNLYARYATLASELKDTLICGRLGEYRYYDMDQAIGRALILAKRILAHTQPRDRLRTARASAA